jgi:predicted transcriptional regulator of viral defense system
LEPILTRVLALARQKGILRPKDLAALGISHNYLYWLATTGRVVRVGRGLYALPESTLGTNQSLIEVASRHPKGVICLLSALAFHGVGTQMPPAVWLALGQMDRAPTEDSTPLIIVRMASKLLEDGVDVHVIDGVPVRVTSLAKTLADCFKFRSKVGSDAAIEALRDALRRQLVSSDELYRFAVTDRVWNVMRPYAEAIS